MAVRVVLLGQVHKPCQVSSTGPLLGKEASKQTLEVFCWESHKYRHGEKVPHVGNSSLTISRLQIRMLSDREVPQLRSSGDGA